ncbi:MAG: efflux RND transporter periplasmic adaptor subunit [Bryobacteraceae bacterium]
MRQFVLCTALVVSVLWASGCGQSVSSASAGNAAAEGRPPDPTRILIPEDSPKRKQIRIGVVETAEVPLEEVSVAGKVEANPNRVSRVLLPLPGRVVSVMARLGDSVRQGDPLVAIESPDAEAAVSEYQSAQAAVTQAKADLFKAEADLDRSRDLFANDAIAKKEVLAAENAHAQMRSALDQAIAAERQAARRLQIFGLTPGVYGEHVVLPAPVSGKVIEIRVVPGEYRNEVNDPVMTIADLSTVWVAADVPETSIRHIALGDRIDIELAAYPGEIFRGRVTRIADVVDPQTRTIKVQAELANPRGRLRPEMFGAIRNIHATHTLPVVPRGAVLRLPGRDVVYLEKEAGVFVERAVKIGWQKGDRVALSAGLLPGDRIVVDGAMLLQGF